jgi:hypothetical protein
MYDSESSSEAGWIDWFCDLEGHEFFVAVSIYTDRLITLQKVVISLKKLNK